MNDLTSPSLSNLPLSSNQKRLWIVSQQDKQNPAYNLSLSYHFKGEINYEVLNKSMNILFNRQHSMFSVFKQNDGSPYIEIAPRDVTVEFIDFSNSSAEACKGEIISYIGDDVRKSFNIETGPLYRLYLFKENDNSYFFHVTIHHLIFDGWSRRLFSQELSKIYTDLINGIGYAPTPITFHSYNFTELTEASLTKDENKELEEFWEEYLKGSNPELKIIYDYPRKDFSSGIGCRESFCISENASGKLKVLSKERNSTLFKTMLSVLSVLLQKYTNENDICIGFPVSERRLQSQLEGIFGFFVGTSVVRLKNESTTNFKEYITYVNEVTNNAIKNSKFSFDKIVETVNPERSNLNPLFQVSLSWWNDVIVPLDFNGIFGERICIPNGVSPFDISFYIWEDGNIIKGEIEYSVDVLKQETILRLRNNFVNLIEKLVESPNENLNTVSLITESELRLISEINKTYTEYPRDKTIVQLFEEQVNLFSDKTALEFKGETITYKSLNEKANQLARTLRAQGVKSNMPVGILVDKSLEMIVGILGILKAGGAYLPIDPDYPHERIEFIIKESDCNIVLTQHKYMELPLEGQNKLDLNSSSTYHEDNEDIEKIGKPTDLAYFMYTSGTTGVPKGSMIRNYSVVKLVRNINYMDLLSDDSILYTSAIVFDVTTYEIWGALLNGMTLHIVEKDTILDPDALGEELFKHQVTILHLTSALFTQLAEMRTDIFSKLKYLLVGGDVLSAMHINKVRKDNPELKVINCYGPSENTTYSTTFLIDKTYERNIPIGKPVSNSTIYVFDKHLNHQPIGILGELYVGGDGLSKGYLNRDDLNSTKFINNPYNTNEQLYKTGDFGRWLPDGNIEFYGRVDNQIKIRGYRVELEEIESIISKVEGVIETVIKPVKVEEGDFRLVAFINVSSSFNVDDKELSRRIAEKLPYYMVPTAYKFVDSFPKTINGKTDRKALKFDISEIERRDTQDIEVLTHNEEKLLKVWQNVLKTQDILVTDNFFDIGGNSLLAIRLINRIKEEFEFTLNFRELILNPVIRQLGAFIDNHKKEDSKIIDLVHLTRTTNLPLSLNQKRLWLISRMDPDKPSYIIPYTFKFSGILDLDIFQKSLEKLFLRHHVVFSVIKEKNGEPYCDIVPSKVDISFFDYSGFSEETKLVKVNEIIEGDSRKAYELDKGPLYRLYLIMTGKDEYYFHLSIHHIIFDGWSWSVFANDLSKIYNSLLKGKEIILEELEFQEYDYANWENSSAGSESEKKSIEFWEKNLKGTSPILNFPYDFQRKENPSGRGSVERINFTKDMSEQLRRFCIDEGSSLFTTLFSVFGIFMHKYSGEDDFNIGLPVAYRPHSKLENIFGMFVNTIVVRLKYEKGQTFKNIIRQTSEAAMNAIAHQNLAFDKVVEIVNPERSSNVNPLFQIAFAWQNNLEQPMMLDEINSERIPRKERTTEFDITFNFWEKHNLIEGTVEYNLDLLKRETIIRLCDNFLTLAKVLLAISDTPIDSLPMISDEEQMMIDSFNNTNTNYPKDKTIVQLFEDQVNLFPNKTAVAFKKVTLTFRQLNEKSNQLASTLRQRGVARNSIVGIMVEKSIDMIVGILGILKAGGAYLPIDPDYPEQRINFIIKDSACRILLTQDVFMNLTIEGIQKINLSAEELYNGEGLNKDYINMPSDLAYIMYTSGTTGIPKGSMISQQSVVRLVRNTNYINITAEDRILLTGAIVFDATTFEIWGALLNGGSLYLIDKETILNPQMLGEELHNNNITILWLTSPLFTQIAEVRTDIFSKLKYLLVGGDVLSAPHINKVRKDNPKLKVINGYGPTENTTFSTTYLIDRDYESNNIPIGKPISNSTTYIFDKNMNYQPIGVVGNLYVGGDGLSKGYLNRDDLNAKSFVEHPNKLGVMLYNTGDLARWLPDGNIEFHGRIDNQIKIRGFRVELDEIESVISEIDDIIETVIKPVKIQEGNYKLVAFLNVVESFTMDTREIEKRLKKKLPSYMIPSAYKFMHGFPKTINGKIDRKALNFDIRELEEREREETEVLSLTEKALLDIWCDILKTKDITSTDNFFDIGGNSLLVIRLINKIKEQTGVELSFKECLLYPTINQLGSHIDGQYENKSNTIELIHLTEMLNLPLTSNQRRLWLISRMESNLSLYTIHFTYKFFGALDRYIFQKSLEKLFLRHHIVFSVIKEKNGEPYCDIVPSKVDISFFDYSGFSEETKLVKVNEIIEGDSRKAYELDKGPLYRLYLIMTGKDEYYFHLSIHHIIFDGWSWSVFANDLSKIYNSLLKGKEIILEELEFQEYDYANWENSSAGSESEKKSIEFWEKNLKGTSPILNFPYDFQRKENPSGRGSVERFCLSKDMSEQLRRVCIDEGSSLFTTLFSVFGIQMHKYSGEDDFNIGLPVAYRPHSKLENIFGMFVNTVVVRLKYEKGQTFKNIIRQTSEAAMNAIAHQNLAFDKVVEIVNPERASHVNPLFQVAFAWQNNLDKPIKFDGIRSEQIAGKDRAVDFDITLSLWENNSIIEGEIEYNIDLLKRETVIQIKDNFVVLVKALLENSDTPIESLSMISDEERMMIDGFNNTNTNYPKDKTIVQLFEDQVNLFPDKTAIVFKESSLTYRQLNEKTNQLARILRKSGVSANQPVGIMIDKSVDMIVGIFGILKAGGGYLPIDPEYPEQRINFIIKDSGCKILLTQEKYDTLPIEGGVAIFNLDSENVYHNDKSNIEGVNASSDLAYIIYTSGTTGIPKGTLIPQQGVVRLVRNTNYIEFTPDDRVLQAAAIVFDASTEEIFGALLNGATLYIVDKETLLDPNAFGEILLSNSITIVDLASALFTQIAESRTDIFSKVKKLILGGDVLSAPHVNKVRKNNPQLTVINTYGPTENSCNSTAYTIDRDFEYNIPIGKPISNSTAYIFDKNLNYQPLGIIGELYVGGDGISIGYLNREDLNRTSFIDNPHFPGERLYKTGDLARWLSDGNIEFHGRIDNQIKIRGFRVELEEVESVISEIDGIIETVIKPIKVEEGDYKLIAFLNVQETANIDKNEIERIIKAKLPPYMVPSAYKFMHGFKKTVNGKIDRKALDFDLSELKEEERKEITVLSPTGEALLAIWWDVLKTKDIVSTDNFFDIGGNSLLVLRCINKIKERFGVDLTFREFIADPNINQLAILIDSQNKNSANIIELVHTSETKNLPLTNNQKRLWFISKMDPDISSYIIHFTFKFFGILDREIFQKSIEILFHRHHIMFSVINERNGEPYCDIVPSKVDISFYNYTGLQENEKLEKVDEVFKEDSLIAFDLSKGPLYRLYLIMTAQEEYYFRLSIHHIIFDGWSWPVLVDDLNKIYNSLLKGKEIDLEEIEFQQVDDDAQWKNSPVSSESEKKSIEFWEKNLKGNSPILNFPYDYQRKGQSSSIGSFENIRLSEELSEQLRSISTAEGASLFSTLLSVFSIQMYKYSGEEDLNIGSPMAYRPHSKLENIIGMFVNTVVLRFRYEKGQTFRNIIQQTNKTTLDAIAHQNLSFDKVVKILNPERVTNVNPLFQVAFVWQSNLEKSINLDGIRSEKITGNERAIAFDITLFLWEDDNHIEGEIIYNTDILERETIIRLRDNFIYLLQSLVENPNRDISEFSIVTEVDKKQPVELVNIQVNSKNSIKNQKDDLINDLLKELNFKGIKLTYENGKLKYFGPEQHITPVVLKKLKDNKENLIKYLQSLEKPEIIPNNLDGTDKEQSSRSVNFDDFEQLLSYLQNHGYRFSIKNAKLIYEAPNQEQNEEVDKAIAKHYRHLYQFYWPIPDANLTIIQPEGPGDPFFIVHGEQSTPFLQDNFGKELPLFDYFHQSYDGSRMKYKTVEEVAELYLQQLLSIKSEGSFLLGGYSFGGLVAYEMAHRLLEMGKDVKLLVIIDTATPDFNDYIYKFDTFKNKFKFYLLNPIREGFSSIKWRIYCNSLLMMGKPVPAHLRTFYIVDNYRKASNYKPPQFNGKLLLVTAKGGFQSRDPYLGWKRFIKGDIELVSIPGSHREMVKNPEIAKMLADKIKSFVKTVLS